MPEIVEVDRRKPRALEQSGKVPADGPRVEWCAKGTGEHPVTRDPAIPGYQPGGAEDVNPFETDGVGEVCA